MSLTPDAELVHYLDDADRLESAMRANLSDSEFAKAGGEIIYIVDANIVGLFIRPSENLNFLSVFQRWLPDTVLVTTAALTAEYIFSGNLPGQGSQPIYMSPSHYEEVINITSALQRRLTKEINEAERKGGLYIRRNPLDLRRTKELASLLEDKRVSPTAKISAIADRLPPEINDLVEQEGTWASAVQLKRLFQEQKGVRRIDTATWFNASFEPSRDHVLEWYDHVRKFRPAAPPPLKDSRHRERGQLPLPMTRLLNDASTLATLELLARDSEQNRVPARRYILITGDSAIRQAVEEFAAVANVNRTSDFTRHAREFTPLLNLSAISINESSPEDLASARVSSARSATRLTSSYWTRHWEGFTRAATAYENRFRFPQRLSCLATGRRQEKFSVELIY